ncbi:MAG: MFS transporter [Bacteroidetes bacterium]|nr:MFS transporter [Bacteroidota bacterium]MBT6684956.1 MFS transporter [Bacteroidota bacterium]MBT7144355.1 MFS transporter [Bacteroidota bacterium]MBT7491805.1 MFS transporter [Bacteroidota bacterium]
MKKPTNWLPLFSTNFLGVFNDNFLKNLICFVCIYWFAKENHSMIIAIASSLLVIPYIFFSPLAGSFAGTKSKVKIVRMAKLLEMPIMLIAIAGFYAESIYIVLFAMLLMGIQSAIFSPSKYGLIRDIGGVEGISFGTGSMEMLTFVAVLIGTFVAGVVSDIQNYREIILASILILVALSGWLTSKKIVAKESDPESISKESVNPVVFLRNSFKYAMSISGLNYIVLSLSTFWFIGSMLQMNLLIYCPNSLGMSNTETGIVMSLVAIGIGLGCGFAGLVSKDKINLKLLPFGGTGLSLSISLIYILEPDGIVFKILLVLASFSAGLFKVPLNAWIQKYVTGRKLGEMIAYNNLVVFIFILISAGVFGLMESYFNSRIIFLIIAVFSWLITIVALLKIPNTAKQFFGIFNTRRS